LAAEAHGEVDVGAQVLVYRLRHPRRHLGHVHRGLGAEPEVDPVARARGPHGGGARVAPAVEVIPPAVGVPVEIVKVVAGRPVEGLLERGRPQVDAEPLPERGHQRTSGRRVTAGAAGRPRGAPEYAKLLIRLRPGSSTSGPTPQMNASS